MFGTTVAPSPGRARIGDRRVAARFDWVVEARFGTTSQRRDLNHTGAPYRLPTPSELR